VVPQHTGQGQSSACSVETSVVQGLCPRLLFWMHLCSLKNQIGPNSCHQGTTGARTSAVGACATDSTTKAFMQSATG
jgi:hypothetical protein